MYPKTWSIIHTYIRWKHEEERLTSLHPSCFTGARVTCVILLGTFTFIPFIQKHEGTTPYINPLRIRTSNIKDMTYEVLFQGLFRGRWPAQYADHSIQYRYVTTHWRTVSAEGPRYMSPSIWSACQVQLSSIGGAKSWTRKSLLTIWDLQYLNFVYVRNSVFLAHPSCIQNTWSTSYIIYKEQRNWIFKRIL